MDQVKMRDLEAPNWENMGMNLAALRIAWRMESNQD